MPSQSSRRLNAEESRLVEVWARFGNRDELKRICKGILARPRQGYAVAFEAQHIIRAHADYWRLDVPIEANGTRKNRALLKKGPSIVRWLDSALRDMIDLHRQAEKQQHWYGKKVVAGEIKGYRHAIVGTIPRTIRARSQGSRCRSSLADAARYTPEMWLIPPRGNPRSVGTARS